MRRVVDVVVASACVCLVVTGRLTFLFEMLNSDDAIWRQSARWVAASVTGAALATHVDAPLAVALGAYALSGLPLGLLGAAAPAALVWTSYAALLSLWFLTARAAGRARSPRALRVGYAASWALSAAIVANAAAAWIGEAPPIAAMVTLEITGASLLLACAAAAAAEPPPPSPTRGSGVSRRRRALFRLPALVALAAVSATPLFVVAYPRLRTRDAAFAWVDARGLQSASYTYLAHVEQDTSGYAQDAREYAALADALVARAKGESVSLKMQQFGGDMATQRASALRVCRAALARSVGCIVSAYKPEYADAEFAVAMELLPGASAPRLVGLCLAVDVADFERQARRVHAFLSRGGTVRLVKGGWYSGSSYSTLAWREVTLRFVALAVVATRWGFGAQMWIATHDLAAAREIAARVDTPPRLSMFHTAYRAGRGATAGVFYGAVPFAQALRDVSWSNAALRFAALRSADLHVSDRMIRARIRAVEALFLLHNASAAP